MDGTQSRHIAAFFAASGCTGNGVALAAQTAARMGTMSPILLMGYTLQASDIGKRIGLVRQSRRELAGKVLKLRG